MSAKEYKKRTKTGKKRGASLGFPTLNLAIPFRFPYIHGVYAGWVKIEGEKHKAAIHFGPVPVFGEKTPVLEAHILDSKLSEKPKKVTFEITHFIRDIKFFEKVEELVKQMEEDIKTIKGLLEEDEED